MMTEPKKHVYESATQGTPALKMVLVNGKGDAPQARKHMVARPALTAEEAADKERLVRRIIERLEELD